jgi:hypothetical protein
MRKNLIYGKISWSFDEETPVRCLPVPLMRLRAFKINGKTICPDFSDKVFFTLLNFKTFKRLPLEELYTRWNDDKSPEDFELGEGRALLRWMSMNNVSIQWKRSDIIFHSFFKEDRKINEIKDEWSIEHAFSIPPVKVKGRHVKLYLKDEDVIQLMHLPGGQEEDFLELVTAYIRYRIDKERYSELAHSFLEWVKFMNKRPLFTKGQLSWDQGRYFR